MAWAIYTYSGMTIKEYFSDALVDIIDSDIKKTKTDKDLKSYLKRSILK